MTSFICMLLVFNGLVSSVKTFTCSKGLLCKEGLLLYQSTRRHIPEYLTLILNAVKTSNHTYAILKGLLLY